MYVNFDEDEVEQYSPNIYKLDVEVESFNSYYTMHENCFDILYNSVTKEWGIHIGMYEIIDDIILCHPEITENYIAFNDTNDCTKKFIYKPSKLFEMLELPEFKRVRMNIKMMKDECLALESYIDSEEGMKRIEKLIVDSII